MREKRTAPLAARLAAAVLAVTAAAAATPSVPEKPTPAPSASVVSPAAARALFAKVVEALGGRNQIAKVKDVRTRGEVTARAASGEMNMAMETTMVFPDRLAQQVDGPFGRFTMIATPAGAYVLTAEGPRDLPEPMRDELLRQVERTAFFLAQKADDPRLVVGLGGEPEKIGEISALALDVSYGDVGVRWFVDPASGRILRSAHDSKSPAGRSVRVVSNFSDFKTVEGFTLPHHIEVSTEGEPDQTLVLQEIKINPGADPKLFQRPTPAARTPTPPAPKPS